MSENAAAAFTAPGIDSSESTDATGRIGRFLEACADEHPTIVGGRVGACLFSSLVFPVCLWAVGAVSPKTALGIASAMTLLSSHAVLSLGGQRIARVLALEVVVAAIVLLPKLPAIPALMAAAFSPPLGMLACVLLGTRLTAKWFVRDERPLEVHAAIAPHDRALVTTES